MFFRAAIQVRCFVLFWACWFSFIPSTSFSQTTGISGINLDFSRPNLDGLGGFSTESQALLEGGHFFFEFSNAYLFGPLMEIEINNTSTRIVDDVSVSDVIATYGITNFLTISLDLPIYVYAREANFNTSNEFTHQSIGDLNISFKFRLIEETKKIPGIAFIVRQSIPTGKENNFLGNSQLTPSPIVVIGKKFGMFSLATNVGVDFAPETNVQGVSFNDRITYSAAAQVPFGFLDKTLFFVGEFKGQTEIQNPSQITSPLGFMAGLKKEFRNGFSILAGGGGGWNNAFGNPIAKALLSMGYKFNSNPQKATLPPIPRPKIAEIPSESTLLIKVANPSEPTLTIHYESNQYVPSTEDYIRLQEIAVALAWNTIPISIEGHTDSVGNANLNQSLSEKRALFVRDLMLKKGVPLSCLTLKSMGESKPIASNQTPDGRMQNRRVEISPNLQTKSVQDVDLK